MKILWDIAHKKKNNTMKNIIESLKRDNDVFSEEGKNLHRHT